ncbi:MAG: SLC13 family permease [Planctomycetaceae bacterium]|nr:SLC13 family permease [Planctomycetaceae bacterium]
MPEAAPGAGNRWVKPAIILIVVTALAILLAPTPDGMRPAAQRLLAVTVLMAGLWMTQAISLAATSLLPLALYPLLGIQPARIVSKAYINDNVFLYLGGFIIALGIERWGLHKRIALNIVQVVGVSPRRLVLGFLIASAGLSMWISNTATTLLMLPIALALLKTLEDEQPDGDKTAERSSLARQLSVPLLLSIAYASSLGGLTTIIGTPTNNAAVAIYRETFVETQPQTAIDDVGDPVSASPSRTPPLTGEKDVDISVAGWMIACIPIGIVYAAICWAVLTFGLPRATDRDDVLQQELGRRLEDLGKASAAEKRMSIVFGATAALWVLRKPISLFLRSRFPDIDNLTTAVDFTNDSTISVAMAVLLFCLPSGQSDNNGRPQPLMNWTTASKLPWDIMLLFGGGFALAGAFESTELSLWLGGVLQGPLQGMALWKIIAVLCLFMTFLTEFTSNVATVNTLLPTLCVLSINLGVDPRLIIVPTTLATSCAFMLPIATPPNAIVFGSGCIRVSQMMRYGLLLNLVGVPVLTAATFLLIKPLMGIP